MRRSFPLAALALLALAPLLAGCGMADALGLGGKRAPDEFAVVKRAPLVLPPNFALRPPDPGAARPQELAPTEEARRQVLATAGAAPAEPDPTGSPGEQRLLRAADALDVDPAIRGQIDRETSQLAERSKSFTDRLLFWREQPPAGEIVDARAEANRIRENQAAGRSVVEGTTPVIRHRQRGLLEGIF